MKTADIVVMNEGYYVTRRYNGMNQGSQFFKKKKEAEAYAKAWTGKG